MTSLMSGSSHHHLEGDIEMDVLLIVIAVMGLFVFAGLAELFGFDSRETVGDDWARRFPACH
jgi:hypothetical protein